MCFAFSNTLPALRANVHYYTGLERIGKDITFDLRNCPEWPVSFDASWRHLCINLHTCLSDYDREGQRFQVEKLAFDSGGTFWLDEVAIAAGSVVGERQTKLHGYT